MTKPTSNKNIMIKKVDSRQKIQHCHQKLNISIDHKPKKDVSIMPIQIRNQSTNHQKNTFQRESLKNHVFFIIRFKFFNVLVIDFQRNPYVIVCARFFYFHLNIQNFFVRYLFPIFLLEFSSSLETTFESTLQILLFLLLRS